MSFSTTNAMFLKKKIEEIANKMIDKMSPVKILNYHQKNFAINYEDMEKVKISNFFRNIKIKKSMHHHDLKVVV